jgi:phosphoribosylglycinamide formyltransferase 1
MDASVAVLVSGSGTNLQALLDDPAVGPRVGLVLSDRPGAGGLARAEARGVPTLVIDPSEHPDRAGFTDAVRDALVERGMDTVVLAGFMRVLGPSFFPAFPHRVLNVHPALLPAFPGAHAVADALACGAKVTGVTVHIVDEEVDHGPIVLQEAIEIREDDDWDSLEARVHAVEHRLLPRAVAALLGGRLVVTGRRATIVGEDG